jgi:photosystem II stability/assembly factor-like uncharacterized protein
VTGVTGATGPRGVTGPTFDLTTNPYPFLDIFSKIGTTTTMDNSTNGYNSIALSGVISSVSMSSSGKYQIATILTSGVGYYFSNNYGSTWTNPPTSFGNMFAVSMSASGQYITVVQKQGSIYISSNFGSTWTQIVQPILPITNYYSGISVSASGKYQSVVFNYSNLNTGIATSSDFGATWSISGGLWVTTLTNMMSIAVSATGQFQTVVSPGNIIYTTSNYGVSWNTITTFVTGNNICSVAMSASGQYQTAVVAVNSPTVFISSNYGVTWTQNTNAPGNYWNSVAISASGQYQVAVVGQIAAIYLSMDYGNTWTLTYSISVQFYNANPAVSISSSGQYITGVLTGLTSGYITTREILMPAKTFIIDHPRDSSKHLIHACIEGPEAGVYYRGRGEIINNESVEILLPEYVESLAKDFTIEITHIYDGTQPKSYSVSEILYNRFTVYGENGSFYWQVTGARSNIIVEHDKNETSVRGNTDGPYLWIE